MSHPVTFNLSHSVNMYICFLITFCATPYHSPTSPVLVLQIEICCWQSVSGACAAVFGDKANKQYAHSYTAYFPLESEKKNLNSA
jgi:hypothetical protein